MINRAIIGVSIGAVLISTSAPWVRIAEVAPTTAGFYRMLIGAIGLFVICFLQNKKIWVGFTYLFALSLPAVFFALDLIFWHRSIHLVGPGLATILANLQVFCLAGIGYLFLKERINMAFLIGLLLAFSGVFLLVGLDWAQVTPAYQRGVLFGVLTALAYTGYILSMRKGQNVTSALSPAANLAVVSLLCSALLATLVYFEGNSFAIPNLKSAFALLALGILCQVIGWLLITTALPKLSASVVGVILLLQPALSMLWDTLFFDRATSGFDVIGSIMVFVGIYLVTRTQANTLETSHSEKT